MAGRAPRQRRSLEPFTGLLGFLGARRNLVPGTALRRLVARNVPTTGPRSCPSPCTSPGVLPAIDWDGRPLVDGGARSAGRQDVALTAPPRGALAMLVHATGLMVSRRFTSEVAALDGGVDVRTRSQLAQMSA